jgi:hypothetical protein
MPVLIHTKYPTTIEHRNIGVHSLTKVRVHPEPQALDATSNLHVTLTRPDLPSHLAQVLYLIPLQYTSSHQRLLDFQTESFGHSDVTTDILHGQPITKVGFNHERLPTVIAMPFDIIQSIKLIQSRRPLQNFRRNLDEATVRRDPIFPVEINNGRILCQRSLVLVPIEISDIWHSIISPSPSEPNPPSYGRWQQDTLGQ